MTPSPGQVTLRGQFLPQENCAVVPELRRMDGDFA